MRLLLTTGSLGRCGEVPRLADEQIVAGPGQWDREIDGLVLSRAVPAGDYDLANLLATLPGGRDAPEALACLVDGSMRGFPRGVGAFGGPKLLLVRDALADPAGLGRLLDYVRTERFDRVVLVENRDDAPAFLAAGAAGVCWYPGLAIALTEAAPRAVRQRERVACVAAPPAGEHPYSWNHDILAALARAGLPAVPWSPHADERLEFLGSSRFGLMACDRGGLRTEWFEILAAGAVLLTSPPTPEGGFERLWPDGGPFLTAPTPAALVEKVRHLRERPAECELLSKAATAWFDRHLSERVRRTALAALAGFETAPLPAFVEEKPAGLGVTIGFAGWRTAAGVLPAVSRVLERSEAPRIRVAAPDSGPALRRILARFTRVVSLEDAGGPAGEDVDLAVAGQDCDGPVLAGAASVWTGCVPDRAELAAGFVPVAGCPGLWERTALAEAAGRLAVARERLRAGDYDAVSAILPAEAATAPFAREFLLIEADLAVEEGNAVVWEALRAKFPQETVADPRLLALATRLRLNRTLRRIRFLETARCRAEEGDAPGALAMVDGVLRLQAQMPPALALRAWLLARLQRWSEAAAAWRELLALAPENAARWFDLGLALARSGDRAGAVEALRRAVAMDPVREDHRSAFACATGGLETVPSPVRDLLISMPETNRRHGTGVLLQRFFPDSRDFVTLRSFTNYRGVEEFGGVNLLQSAQNLSLPELRGRLRRMLEPFRIRRILCVPFAPLDFLHAVLVKQFSGAPLCTYVMDDQNVCTRKVPDAHARALFGASELRLTISPEMRDAYAARHPFAFEVMPPIVVGTEMRRSNAWHARVRPAKHGALVGNVWSMGQLKQVARFVAASGLSVDWFGRDPHPELERVGLHGRGFLPEAELADRLTGYPFVIVPSGTLDGTEDNEWLTRLSLPSRMVFLLQTQTPILVLGSEETCASRFVRRLGLGLVVPYGVRNAAKALRPLTESAARAAFLEQARRHADAFLMPEAGRWIWDSLKAGRALPAPWDRALETAPNGPQREESVRTALPVS